MESVVDIPFLEEPLGVQKRYDNIADAAMRLQGSIVRFNKRAVFIDGPIAGPADDPVFFAYYLSASDKSTPFNVRVNSPELDVSSPPLGYTFDKERLSEPVFISRNPERRQKQGFDKGRAKYKSHSFYESDMHKLIHGGACWVALSKTIEGIYSSFDECKENQGAFSRDLAITRDKERIQFLGFMGDTIGVFTKSGIALVSKFRTKEFREYLEQNGVKL